MSEENNTDSPEPNAPLVVAKADLDSLDLESAIPDRSIIDCHHVDESLSSYIKANEGSDGIVKPAALLQAIANIHAKFENAQEPYGPMRRYEGRRSLIPTDLIGPQNDELASFVPNIINLPLKARVADVVWLNDRKLRDIADIAIDAYAEQTSLHVAGKARFWHENDDPIDFHVFELLRRGFQIAKAVKGRSDYPDTLKEAWSSLREKCFDSEHLPSIIRIVSLTLDFQLVDEQALAAQAEEVFEKRTKSDPHWDEKFFIELRRIYRRGEQPDKANECQQKIAECYVQRAQEMSGSAMASAHWLMEAINALRQCKGAEARNRVNELKIQLKEKQLDTSFEMATFSHPIELTQIIEDSLAHFEGIDLSEALKRFAGFHAAQAPQKLIEQATKMLQEHPVAAMFGGSHLDSEGKVIAKTPGLDMSDDGNLDPVMENVSKDLDLNRKILAAGTIEPVRQKILFELSPTERCFDVICANSVFIPSHQEYIFSQGFYRFFMGDMLCAGSLLIPQLENSIRHVMAASGHDLSTIENDLTQQDRSLSALLGQEREMLAKVFGDPLLFEIDFLFNRRPGPALRHRLAHGSISSGEFYAHNVIYACWFIYKLACLPLIEHWDQVSDLMNKP